MNGADLVSIVSGAIAMGYAVAGLFFLRFWRETGDRLFVTFSVAFWLLGAQRLALVIHGQTDENHTGLYLVRLLAFVLILAAILDKNRSASRRLG
jgi:Family of unknown function (DUF5985)